uniref:Citropin-1.2 n=1 Tax=Ranoidea citropa TaxID=94770 RepID=CT12_RANCI|nr:RecName: Full=Citropin-1.2; Contains: RecName: Full=Citropin-1.2.1; Contains: RecName: Full=Citropin-1.2.2; Contains: RecName: Full=Citropin-1.2.3 [Ranoidea citropa]
GLFDIIKKVASVVGGL